MLSSTKLIIPDYALWRYRQRIKAGTTRKQLEFIIRYELRPAGKKTRRKIRESCPGHPPPTHNFGPKRYVYLMKHTGIQTQAFVFRVDESGAYVLKTVLVYDDSGEGQNDESEKRN